MKKNIAILFGGYSSEFVISVKSSELIIQSIDKELYNVYPIQVDQENWKYKSEENSEIIINQSDFSLDLNTELVKFDAVYLIIHGTPAEDGKLQGYFESLNVPYIGPSEMQAKLTFNKGICKNHLKGLGVPMATSIIVNDDSEAALKDIGYPCFVKPNEAGSSFGISKVENEGQLKEAISKAKKEGGSVMVEAFIEGIEVTCGVAKINGEVRSLPITEIVSKNAFFDFEAKYTPGMTEEITPARINDSIARTIQSWTQKIYEYLNMDCLARIDFIIKEGVPYMLEVNTIPGMSPQSIIPQQLRQAGYDVAEVINELIAQKLK